MHTPSDDAIRDRAYAMWIEAGSPEGNDQYFWHAAEQELAADEADIEDDAMVQDESHGETIMTETPEQPSQY